MHVSIRHPSVPSLKIVTQRACDSGKAMHRDPAGLAEEQAAPRATKHSAASWLQPNSGLQSAEMMAGVKDGINENEDRVHSLQQGDLLADMLLKHSNLLRRHVPGQDLTPS